MHFFVDINTIKENENCFVLSNGVFYYLFQWLKIVFWK